MIIWIASYPKSGNTWIRSLLSAYMFSDSGHFDFNLLKEIKQFPVKESFEGFSSNFNNPIETTKFWLKAQKKINSNKKVNFLKTHNAMCSINGNNFTDKKNTAACLYVVRDPRNVISSIIKHYELNLIEAFNFITNKRKIIFNNKNVQDYGDIQFLGDWLNHYKSWKENNIFPIKVIKYENLINNTLETFTDVLMFLKKITHININKNKIKKVIESTDFKVLQEKERNFGFDESILSNKDNKKIKFFNLGAQNDWRKLLNPEIEKKIRTTFDSCMRELGYIK